MTNLLENIHYGLKAPDPGGKITLVQGSYRYYHYVCDGFDDRGWGCGYRTLQTLCSWLQIQLLQSSKDNNDVKDVPTIPNIQKCLVTLGDKPESFVGSREWIGSVEVFMCINHFFGVLSKVIHVPSGDKLTDFAETIELHFESFGSPIMMGGDKDASSKGILGICRSDRIYLLVLDPHFVGKSPTVNKLQQDGWIKWKCLDCFLDSSFYNMCLPQYKAITYDQK